METQTPEIENKYTELSPADRIAEIEKIKSTMTAEEIEKVFTTKPIEVAPIETPKQIELPSSKLEPQIEMVAQTLMASAEEKIKNIYADFDYSGIKNDVNLNTLPKVTLMSTIAEPNARKMANIEKNLKGTNAEGTRTEIKSASFSAPEKSGKVDEKAGEKYYTLMSQKLGFNDETEKSE